VDLPTSFKVAGGNDTVATVTLDVSSGMYTAGASTTTVMMLPLQILGGAGMVWGLLEIL
jgi:hypothetical protein